jgi:hypothetical protein
MDHGHLVVHFSMIGAALLLRRAAGHDMIAKRKLRDLEHFMTMAYILKRPRWMYSSTTWLSYAR